MSKTFYITTPIYYVNAPPHVGHAYTTLAADILARWKKVRNEPVRLLTGTDEHGSKIEAVAKAAGMTPSRWVDETSSKFKDLWAHLDVRYDDYIRTTQQRHTERVQGVFEHLLKTGDIYKGVYRGYYCVSDETYWTETQAPPDEKNRRLCPNPDCRRELQLMEEDSYFFRLSKYQRPLQELYENHPGFLMPGHRAPEILNFVSEGLQDLAVSRSRSKVSWGIQVRSDPHHVVYVWFDALLNYITAIGYTPGLPHEKQDAAFRDLWPADVHFVGKEIYRFHAVIWPAMLMALKLPAPKTVFAHGWWTVEGEKMSKSKDNFIDPREFTAEYGLDAFRYFLFREMPFGNDGDFSRQAFRRRYNSELANDLGNLVSRVANLVDKYLAGELPGKPNLESGITKDLGGLEKEFQSQMQGLAFQGALNIAWSAIGRLNQHVDKEAPWKRAVGDPAVKALLFDMVSSIRMVAGWITPFMPQTAAKIQAQLGVRQFPTPLTAEEVLTGPSGAKITKGPALFPRKQ